MGICSLRSQFPCPCREGPCKLAGQGFALFLFYIDYISCYFVIFRIKVGDLLGDYMKLLIFVVNTLIW